MLKPAKMRRIRLVFSKGHSERVLTILHDMGVMQIEYVPAEAAALLNKGDGYGRGQIGDYAQRFRGLESQLYRSESDAKYRFESIDELLEKADSIKIDKEVAHVRKRIDDISADTNLVLRNIATLKHMPAAFTQDLSMLTTSRIASFLVTGQHINEFAATAPKELGDAIVLAGTASVLVCIDKSDQAKFSKLVEGTKLHVEPVPKLSGTAEAELQALEKAVADNRRRQRVFEEELERISKEYYPEVSAIREQLDLEVEKQEITARLGIGRSIVAIDGWVPEESVHRLSHEVGRITSNAFVMENVRTDALPPTKLENPVNARLYEFFIRFYSLPRSDEVDPTLIFAIVFPIFFGLMIGDVGYGAAFLLGAVWLNRRLAHPPKKSRIPKALSGFVHTIISNNGLNTVMRSIIPGSVIAIALGVLFNEYFGFQLPYTAPFSVTANVATLLVISGWIGVFMVSFGFALGFLNRMAAGETKKAAAKLGWLAAAWAIVILGLAVLHAQPLGLSNPLAILAYALLVGGMATVLYGEGFEALMELPSLISHILSYTRLVGILLASVILAEVIDLIFLKGIQHSILLGAVGIAILVIGQLFNMLIAIFEPGIQGARLIYVEFFSKFFSGNGREFRPFASRRMRTLSKFDIEKRPG